MERRVISQWMSNQMREWRLFTRRSREVKINVLQKWMEYKYTSVGRLFLSWRNEIRVRMEQNRFISSYLRMKLRKKMSKIFRTWMQQSRYGRISSLYSRQQLIEQLAIQTRKIEVLETANTRISTK